MSPQPNLYTNDELIRYLKDASEREDGYLGRDDYVEKKDESWPAPKTLSERFGSWRNAKIRAGLPARSATYNEDQLTGKEYYDYVKDGLSCVICDEGFNSALAFHHPPEKERGMDTHISSHSAHKVKSEIEGCIAVCFNCHQKHHSSDHELNVNNKERVDPPEVEYVRPKLI